MFWTVYWAAYVWTKNSNNNNNNNNKNNNCERYVLLRSVLLVY